MSYSPWLLPSYSPWLILHTHRPCFITIKASFLITSVYLRRVSFLYVLSHTPLRQQNMDRRLLNILPWQYLSRLHSPPGGACPLVVRSVIVV